MAKKKPILSNTFYAAQGACVFSFFNSQSWINYGLFKGKHIIYLYTKHGKKNMGKIRRVINKHNQKSTFIKLLVDVILAGYSKLIAENAITVLQISDET